MSITTTFHSGDNMKKFLMLTLICASLVGCDSHNEHGKCIGLLDDGEPGVRYELSILNTALAIIFVETVIVPVVIVAKETKCPK